MELPKRFKLSFAEVKNEILYIYKLMRFEDMMYELTYSLKDMKCVYCGKKLHVTTRTIDHRYPRDTGGISITNNLFPCCGSCNTEKSNLTHKEYLKLKKKDSKKERKKYLQHVCSYNKKVMKNIGYKLPKKWVEMEYVDNIKYDVPQEYLRGKKYNKILEFYNKYGKILRPVIVDKNNNLLDGFNVLLFAMDFEIEKVPKIRLENVILLSV
jgi:hypothetical protein